MGIKYEDFTAQQWVDGNEDIKTQQELGQKVFMAWIEAGHSSRFGEVAEIYRQRTGKASCPDIVQVRQQIRRASIESNSETIFTVVYGKKEGRMITKSATPNSVTKSGAGGATDKPDYSDYDTRLAHAMKIIRREIKAGRVATVTEWADALDRVTI